MAEIRGGIGFEVGDGDAEASVRFGVGFWVRVRVRVKARGSKVECMLEEKGPIVAACSFEEISGKWREI